MPAAILFDLDNTLIDRDAAYARWRAAEPEAGTSEDEVAAKVPGFVGDAPAARALLARLRAHTRVGLVSNGGAETQRRKLAAAGLEDSFDVVVISGEAGVAKPAPAIFARALAALEVRAEDALFVGDDPEADIVGARAAGMRTCWVRRGRAWPRELARPDRVLERDTAC